jgi:hypothetical protein
MPDIFCVKDSDIVTAPAAQQFRRLHRHIDEVEAAPVASDEIDRFVETLQLALKPVAVVARRRREAVGRGAPNPSRKPHHHISSECGDERAPDCVGLRIAITKTTVIAEILSVPSTVPGGLLRQLHARRQPELRVDVREVGLHGSRRYEQPGGDVLVGEALSDQPHDI